ncbi:MAG: DUF3276 family protein [Treponema sp.]|nr:DUF3276 family protein [Treponema sp.]
MAIRGELYTRQVNLENRSYFFNVKENRNGDIFLQVVESKIKDGVDDRRAIVIFAEDMQRFLSGMEGSLDFIEKEHRERAKIRAAKKAEREAKYAAMGGAPDAGKKVYRRKGESRLVAERRSERQDDGIKRTGKVIHVTSKRNASDDTQY